MKTDKNCINKIPKSKTVSLKMPVGANYLVDLKQLIVTFDGDIKLKGQTLDGKNMIYVTYKPIHRTVKKLNK